LDGRISPTTFSLDKHHHNRHNTTISSIDRSTRPPSAKLELYPFTTAKFYPYPCSCTHTLFPVVVATGGPIGVWI
jgi:hypothetical protein